MDLILFTLAGFTIGVLAMALSFALRFYTVGGPGYRRRVEALAVLLVVTVAILVLMAQQVLAAPPASPSPEAPRYYFYEDCPTRYYA